MFNHHGPALAVLLFYLDPGSGSFLVQLLLGAALSLAVAAKAYWGRIKGFLSGKKASPPEDADDE